MDRVAVVGCAGAGKSTLSRALGARLGAPVIHLDTLFWKPGWVESDPEAFGAAVDAAAAGARWVIDGGYSRHSAARFARADTVVWLDPPRRVCLWRALRRSATLFGKIRPDLAPGCPERIDPAFYRYIWNWKRANRPRLEETLARHASHARVVRLRSDRQTARFLSEAGQNLDFDVKV
ncbi:MAG: hypothetical protein ABI376_10580 [Caulobacteraceae bacterium]